MRIERICTKEVIAVEPDDPLSRVTHEMRENHVGAVVVHVDGRPVGIVTDRDIALRLGGRLEALANIKAREIMSKDVVTARPDEDICDVLERMRDHGVRRIPVVNDLGLLVGLASFDDVLLHLARTMRTAADAVLGEMAREAQHDEGANPAP